MIILKFSCLTYKTDACLPRLHEGAHMPEHTLEITLPEKVIGSFVRGCWNVETRRNGGHKTDKDRSVQSGISLARERYAHAAGLIIAIEIF